MSIWRLLLVAMILLGVYWMARQIVPRTAGVADRQGNYFVDVSANGTSGNSIKIAFSRPTGVWWMITIVIPSGTVIYSHDHNGQRLITAAPIKVVLSNEVPSVTIVVPTYCIDEFATTPIDGATLEFDPPNNQSEAMTEETEPLHKLADCMMSSSMSTGGKQLAVWAVADDLLRKTPDDALQFLTARITQKIINDKRREFRDRKSHISSVAYLLSDEEINQLIESELQSRKSDFERSAASYAQEQLDALAGDLDVLTSCGYKAEDMRLF
jgi:hypothetical protein